MRSGFSRARKDIPLPKPPILPEIDWKSVFDGAMEFDTWIEDGEKEENRRAMKEARASFSVDAPTAAFVAALERDVYVIAIAEDWCPDVVRHVPVLQGLADGSARVHVRYVTREAHPDVFIRFLTNGGESVPKFVFLSDRWVQCGDWGPMPEDLKTLIARGRACGDNIEWVRGHHRAKPGDDS